MNAHTLLSLLVSALLVMELPTPAPALGQATPKQPPDARKMADPLPDPRKLKEITIANLAKSGRALENYSCIVRNQSDELNSDGSVKQQHFAVEENFYIHGVRVRHVLSRNGKSLTGEEAKKEQSRVDKEVARYSDVNQVEKREAQNEQRLEMLLEALKFTNGRRELRDGRRTVVYDLTGDPDFRPRNLEGRFAQALTGRTWVDEESGTAVELRVHTDHDVKIGGGLLANVHKGFQFHLVQQRQPDGAWLTNLKEGSGDLRAGLFMHPRFRFKQELDKCHLFSVDTQTEIHKPSTGPAERAKP